MITLSDLAREQIEAALEQQRPQKTALRVEATVSGAEFVYSMKLVGEEERQPEDVLVDVDGLQVLMDPRSAENLKGASIDFEEGILRSGFRFDNPNKPESPVVGQGPRPDLDGPVAERIQRLIDTELNPAVAAHGGVIQFLGVRDRKVYLGFGGGCHGCGMVDVTLKQGVEARIRELIPEIEEVIDTTDHSVGENPYYS